MPSRYPIMLAALLLAPAAALAEGGPGRPPGAGGPVAVYRGTRADVPPAVPVYRGRPAAVATPAEEAPAGPELLAAGNRLWIVDRDTGTLTACRVGATTRVGRDRVRCVERELPDG